MGETLRLISDVLGPVVALVALGALAGPRLGLDLRTLTKLAYWILGPAFVFSLLADADVSGSVILKMSVACLAGMAAAGGLAAGAVRAQGSPSPVVSAAALSSMHGNVGNAGLAIATFALSDDVLPLAAIAMLAINLAGLLFGVGAASAQDGGLLKAVGKAVFSPMIVAAMVAVPFNVADADLPKLLDRPIDLLAGSLIPIMLITLGLQLMTYRGFTPSFDIGAATVAKLVIAPVVAALAASLLNLDGDAHAVTVIQSGMPPAVFTALVALEHDLEPQRVTATLITATLASLVTLPILLSIVT